MHLTLIAWLYSGIAFRMAIDLGIHLHSDKLRLYVKSLSPEDIEIRKRLFWSCYTWDKAISLYCGRMPAFTPPMETTIPQFSEYSILRTKHLKISDIIALPVMLTSQMQWMILRKMNYGHHITAMRCKMTIPRNHNTLLARDT